MPNEPGKNTEEAKHFIGGFLTARNPRFLHRASEENEAPYVSGQLITYGGQSLYNNSFNLEDQYERDLIATGPIASSADETEITDPYAQIYSKSAIYAPITLNQFTLTPKGDIIINFRQYGRTTHEGYGVQVFLNSKLKETVWFQGKNDRFRLHYEDHLFKSEKNQTLYIVLRLVGESGTREGGFALERIEVKIEDPA